MKKRKSPTPVARVADDFESRWPGASALATDCVINLFWIKEKMDAFSDALVRKHGLPSPAAFNALSILGGAGGALSPSEIAERMIVSRPTMTGILQSLESRGLVRIVPHPRDRRSVHVEIAPAGQARVDALRPELHRVEKRWMSCLTQSEKQAFLGLLAKLQRHPPEVE